MKKIAISVGKVHLGGGENRIQMNKEKGGRSTQREKPLIGTLKGTRSGPFPFAEGKSSFFLEKNNVRGQFWEKEF